jgi:hypothetical protein
VIRERDYEYLWLLDNSWGNVHYFAMASIEVPLLGDFILLLQEELEHI